MEFRLSYKREDQNILTWGILLINEVDGSKIAHFAKR